MNNVSERYTQILSDIENHISNENEKKYVSSKVQELTALYMDLIDRISRMNNNRIEELEQKQDKMVVTLAKLQETLNLIKSDIYEEDGYDFEIVCPYCNHEFVADIEEELKEEIECPECHNIIELDWEDECGCEDCNDEHCNCDECQSKDTNQKNNTQNEKEDKKNENEDDM